MKKQIIFLSTILFFSCSNNNVEQLQNNYSVVKVDSTFKVGIINEEIEEEIEEKTVEFEDKDCLKRDLKINKVFKLNDAESFKKSFEFDVSKAGDYQISDLLYFMNKDTSQFIGFTENYGGGINEYKAVRVEYIPNKKYDFVPMNERNLKKYYKESYHFEFIPSNFIDFETESGVKLGLTEKQFIAIYSGGKLKREVSDGLIKYYYNFEQDFFFCDYFSEFVFENNQLVKFSFGYVNP